MSTIFPGMDPYLEDPRLWPGVHNALIVYIRDQLQPLLRPRYVAAFEERVYLEGPGPSLEIHESYIAILDLRSGRRVVTVIEVLSPSNKYAGEGRAAYLRKQREILASDTQLVEIDLLRAGPHTLAVPAELIQDRFDYDYLMCVNRAVGTRGSFELYPRSLRARLPRIKVPLADNDPAVILDLQAALARTHEAGAYAERIDYGQPCIPPLSAEDQAWAGGLVSGERGA